MGWYPRVRSRRRGLVEAVVVVIVLAVTVTASVQLLGRPRDHHATTGGKL